MEFLVFLLAYLIRRRLDRLGRLSCEPYWRSWFQGGNKVAPGREAEVWRGVLLVTIPALLLMVAEYALQRSGWSLVFTLPELILLVLLTGTPGWGQRLHSYGDAWSRGDMQGAWHYIRDLLPANQRGAALSPDEMHLLLSRHLLGTVFERFFLVAFWYLVGGIGVALLARGLVALRDHWPQDAARGRFAVLAAIAAWIPVRLLSFTFGIAGDLAGWMRGDQRALARLSETPDRVLMAGANSALTGYALDPARFAQLHPDEWPDFGGRSLEAIRDLLNRSMLVWICSLALLVIAGIV